MRAPLLRRRASLCNVLEFSDIPLSESTSVGVVQMLTKGLCCGKLMPVASCYLHFLSDQLIFVARQVDAGVRWGTMGL